MAQTILSATSTLLQQTVANACRQDCLRHEKDGGDRFRIAAVLPSLPKIGAVILASRREALYGRSSYLDAPSEWHRASSAGPD